MMTPEKAAHIVHNKYPDYVIEWCIPYKNSFIVMAHPEGNKMYMDPYFSVNKLTGRIQPFVPVCEKDTGRAFFAAAEKLLVRDTNDK